MSIPPLSAACCANEGQGIFALIARSNGPHVFPESHHLHHLLHTLCSHLFSGFEPHDKLELSAANRSCGGQPFLKLPHPLRYDWVVCASLHQ